jgi:hypothetical protein
MYQSLTDLFGNERFATRYKGNGKQQGTERGSLISYFATELEREVKFVAVRTSHYTMSELYSLKSSFSDRLNRNGKEAARKYFFWITRTKREDPAGAEPSPKSFS